MTTTRTAVDVALSRRKDKEVIDPEDGSIYDLAYRHGFADALSMMTSDEVYYSPGINAKQTKFQGVEDAAEFLEQSDFCLPHQEDE